jgi:hypothetical protein
MTLLILRLDQRSSEGVDRVKDKVKRICPFSATSHVTQLETQQLLFDSRELFPEKINVINYCSHKYRGIMNYLLCIVKVDVSLLSQFLLFHQQGLVLL